MTAVEALKKVQERMTDTYEKAPPVSTGRTNRAFWAPADKVSSPGVVDDVGAAGKAREQLAAYSREYGVFGQTRIGIQASAALQVNGGAGANLSGAGRFDAGRELNKSNIEIIV